MGKQNNAKFYDSSVIMWITLIFIAPVGIWLMWRNNRYNTVIRIVLSTIFGVFFTLAALGSIISNKEDKQTIQAGKVTQKDAVDEKAKVALEAKVKLEAEAKVKADAEAKAKLEAEAKTKADAEAKAKLEAEAKTEADATEKSETVVGNNSQKININSKDYIKILSDLPKMGESVSKIPSYLSSTFKGINDYKKIEFFSGEYNNIKIVAHTTDGILTFIMINVKDKVSTQLPTFTDVTEYMYNQYGEPKKYLPDNGYTMWGLPNNDKYYILFQPKFGSITGSMENDKN